MPTRSSKAPRKRPGTAKDHDYVTRARSVVEQAIGERLDGAPLDSGDGNSKNPHAVALGRLGGQKGGKARSEKLTKTQRSKIAALGAKARWHGK